MLRPEWLECIIPKFELPSPVKVEEPPPIVYHCLHSVIFTDDARPGIVIPASGVNLSLGLLEDVLSIPPHTSLLIGLVTCVGPAD